jgi:lipoprotein-releasing system ATP-binding protein
MSNVILEAQHVTKSFKDGDNLITVLHDVSLAINAGEKVAIMGASGSGKSTLLHLLGGLDDVTKGEISITGLKLAGMNQRTLSKLRGLKLGFVYQFHHLLPELTAEENVAFPAALAGLSISQAKVRARELLAQVELSHRLTHRPAQLSGGERQRVAIARALVNRPLCMLADEPTGNLDRQNAQQIHALINKLNKELGTSFLIVTHDPSWATEMHRVLELVDGHLTV